jgi:hypothetical protein
MLTINDEEWIVDSEAFTCKNNLTKIVVGFTKNGDTYMGKIMDIPLELMARLAKMKDGDLFLQKAVLDAEEIFLKELIDKKDDTEKH